MSKRKAVELLDDPYTDFEISSTDPPVTKGMGFLAAVGGPRLEMMTRTNRAIVGGISAGSAYVQRYKSYYIRSRVERIERLAISQGGLGRSEMIQMVGAGGPVTDAYYGREGGQAADYAIQGDDE